MFFSNNANFPSSATHPTWFETTYNALNIVEQYKILYLFATFNPPVTYFINNLIEAINKLSSSLILNCKKGK